MATAIMTASSSTIVFFILHLLIFCQGAYRGQVFGPQAGRPCGAAPAGRSPAAAAQPPGLRPDSAPFAG